MARRRSPNLTGLVLVALAACGRPDIPQEPLSEETYVGIMTRLVLIDQSPPRRPSEAARLAALDSLRSEALQAYGLTAEDLVSYSALVGGDPDRMEALWRRISAGVDSARSESVASDSTPTEAEEAVDAVQEAVPPPTAGAESRTVPSRIQDARSRLKPKLDSLRRSRAESDSGIPRR